jgi:hypothetical protein
MARGTGTRYFAALGTQVEARWRAHGYADAALPDIAAEELARRPPHEHASPWELAQLGRDPARMPEQGSPGFGQPPLAVWGSGRLYIEVLYWLSATTAIHQHTFSGAFAVFDGSSLHTQYRFRPTRKVSDYLHLGELRWASSELLTRGAVHAIHSGPRFIHALFHLDHPSVSVVVRNYHDDGAPPQLGYFPPGVGIEHTDVEPRLQRALELFRMLVEAGRLRDAERLITGIATRGDEVATYLAMAAISDDARAAPIADWVRARARRRHGALIDQLAAAIDADAPARRVVQARARVTDPELRFFLAALLVVPTPAALRRVIEERVPGQPLRACVAGWLDRLAALGVDVFGMEAAALARLAAALRAPSTRRLVDDLRRVPHADRLLRAARL